MILIPGGTGTLGRFLLPMLHERGEHVRVLTRAPRDLGGADVVQGDVRDPQALSRALQDVSVVVSAISGFGAKPPDGPRTIDRDANIALIRAAADAGIEQFVFVSILGASATHPMELFRMKWEGEEALRRSSLSWSIVRPTAYMETWTGILAAPLLEGGKAMVFGRGKNPINFVSAADVARAVARCIDERKAGAILEIGGPDDISMAGFVETFRSITGARGGTRRIPRPMLRLMSVAARPFNPVLARMSAGAVAMDTIDMTLRGSLTQEPEPGPSTSLTEMLKRDYVQS